MRYKRPLVAITAAAMLTVMFGAGTANANLPGSTFEGNDGNFVVNTAGNTDWVNAPNLVKGVDLPTGNADNSFGNGTKESDVNVTVGDGSIPNSKADLGNFYVANETLSSNNHVMLYLGWTRVNTSGTTNFDFEINKSAQPDLTTPGAKTLVRSVGDIIINYDFLGGAQKPTLAFRTWQANGTWSAATALTGTNGEAEVNRVDLTNPLAVSPSPSTAPAFTFGEAAIDLTGSGIVAPGDCAPFSSAYVKSRSSDSFTSAVKDFIAPVHVQLNTCAEIIIKKVTDPASDTTTSFPFTLTGGPSNLNNSFNLVNGGSFDTGAVLKPGSGYNATEGTTPKGWDLTSAVCDDGSDPHNITLSNNEKVTCTFTNTARANLHVVKLAERNGVDFSFNANAPLSPSTFTLQNGGKQDFLSLVPGTYGTSENVPNGWSLDSATCDNGDAPGAVTLGPGDDVTCTYHDVVRRGALAIHKTAKHAAAPGGVINQSGVVFTVTNATNGTNVQVTTDANGNACADNLPVSVLDGNYTITESVPAGYANDTPTQAYTVGNTTCATADVAQFVNIPLTNLSVSVDSQIAGGTSSTIDCGATASAGPGDDITASAHDLRPGTYNCTIVIDP